VIYVSGRVDRPGSRGSFSFLNASRLVARRAKSRRRGGNFPRGSKTALPHRAHRAKRRPGIVAGGSWARFICLDMPKADPTAAGAATNQNGKYHTRASLDMAPDYVPSYNSNIVSLQSYPGSHVVLLLDFFGGYTPTWGGVNYVRPTNVDNTTIKDLWKRGWRRIICRSTLM